MWVFCSLVSVALSGSYEGVVTVYCLVENSSQILTGVAMERDPGKMCFYVLGA